jgi:hypothetical protein
MTVDSLAIGGLNTAKVMLPTTARVDKPATLLKDDAA